MMSLSREALQMNSFWDWEWVYPRERKHHTHVGPQSHRMHTRREGISSCLRFAVALPELPVLLNPILKARSTPPRLRGSWHWQRMRTQRHIHKHNLHA